VSRMPHSVSVTTSATSRTSRARYTLARVYAKQANRCSVRPVQIDSLARGCTAPQSCPLVIGNAILTMVVQIADFINIVSSKRNPIHKNGDYDTSEGLYQ
jgi:hypothetical protein